MMEDYFNNNVQEQEQEEKQESDSEFDINDYEVPIEESKEQGQVALLNIFLIYYRQLFNKESPISMFDEIDPEIDDSTNRCLELFYEEIMKLKEEPDENNLNLYDPKELNIDECSELYGMYIDNKLMKVCKYVIPIIEYLSTVDWLTINWSIRPLKKINL